jgi:hypothetical protein
MNVYKPLRAVLFFYEVLRVLLLAGLFAFFSPLEGAERGGVFPFLVYVTPNALFPLMALFLWVSLGEFKAFVPLYVAGKVIAVAAYYAWGLSGFRLALGQSLLGLDQGSIVQGIVLLSGGFIVSLGDVISIFGGWMLYNKVTLKPLKSSDAPAADVQVLGASAHEDAGGNGGQ